MTIVSASGLDRSYDNYLSDNDESSLSSHNSGSSTPQYKEYNNWLDFWSGGSYNSAVDNWNAQEDLAYNSALAQQERENELKDIEDARNFEIWKDSTKYQRTVDDLLKAGLNPWLAVQGGLNGSTASVSTGTPSHVSSAAKASAPKSSSKDNTLSNLVTTAFRLLLVATILK